MTLLYTLGTNKYNSTEFMNFGSAVVYTNCVDELSKHDDVVNIYDYIYKHGCKTKIDKVVINGDQTLTPDLKMDRMKFFDAMKNTGLKYITLASSIGDNNLDDIPPKFMDIINQCQQPLHLRETNESLGVQQVLTLDQSFWKDVEHYKLLMQPYRDLNPGRFTFQYQPWNKPNATKPFFDFGVDTDVTSIGEYDEKAGFCKANPLKLSFGNWLWLICNCKTFYTSSYHGFAFAVMFNKRIVCSNIKARRFQSTIKILNIKLSDDGVVENHDEVMTNIENRRREVFDYINEIYSAGESSK